MPKSQPPHPWLSCEIDMRTSLSSKGCQYSKQLILFKKCSRAGLSVIQEHVTRWVMITSRWWSLLLEGILWSLHLHTTRPVSGPGSVGPRSGVARPLINEWCGSWTAAGIYWIVAAMVVILLKGFARVLVSVFVGSSPSPFPWSPLSRRTAIWLIPASALLLPGLWAPLGPEFLVNTLLEGSRKASWSHRSEWAADLTIDLT